MIGYHPGALVQHRVVKVSTAVVNAGADAFIEHEKLGSLVICLPMAAFLLMAWTFHYFRKDLFDMKGTAYVALVSASFCACSICMHTLNKACVSLTGAPSTLTTIQMAITVIVTLALQGREVMEADRKKLAYWLFVPLVYAGMLNSSLLGYEYLTLSLVTVFRNLSPLVTMTVENLCMDAKHRQKLTAPILLSFAVLAVGAFVFSHGQAESTWIGLVIITANTLLAIGDRVLQRRLLVSECEGLPLSACMTLNNSFGMLPTFAMAIAMHEVQGYKLHYTAWTDPATLVLVGMSGCMGMGIGFFGLMCQRAMSATSFQVMQNASKVIVVCVGVFVFGDNLDGPTRLGGMALSLVGSLAYGVAKAMDTPEASPEAVKQHQINQAIRAVDKGESQPLLGSHFASFFGGSRHFPKSLSFFRLKGALAHSEDESP